MSPNFDFDLLNEAIENAPTAGFGPSVTFGRCTAVVKVVSWDRSSGSPKINEVDWDGTSALKDGENFRLALGIDVKELNPAITREWKRSVDIKKSGRKSNGEKNSKALTDWEETTLPSLVNVLGKDWSKKLLGKGVYVEVEEVDTVVLDKSGKPKSYQPKDPNTGLGKVDTNGDPVIYTNSAPRFTRAFKSKTECQAAREERFGAPQEEASESDIPAQFIKDFRGLVGSMGGKVAEAMALAEENNLFPGHSVAAIAVAAGFEVPF